MDDATLLAALRHVNFQLRRGAFSFCPVTQTVINPVCTRNVVKLPGGSLVNTFLTKPNDVQDPGS